MKKLILIAVITLMSLTASALEIIKSGKTTTLVFKNRTEMQKAFSFEKAKKSGHKIVSVAQTGKGIVVTVVRTF